MTVKYIYQCDKCGIDYVEQRGQDEPNPYFSKCLGCGLGVYQEIDQQVLALEPERVPGPEIVIEEQQEEIIVEEKIVEGQPEE